MSLVINPNISGQLKHNINLSLELVSNKRLQEEMCKEKKKAKSDSQQSVLCSACPSSWRTQPSFISLKH